MATVYAARTSSTTPGSAQGAAPELAATLGRSASGARSQSRPSCNIAHPLGLRLRRERCGPAVVHDAVRGRREHTGGASPISTRCWRCPATSPWRASARCGVGASQRRSAVPAADRTARGARAESAIRFLAQMQRAFRSIRVFQAKFRTSGSTCLWCSRLRAGKQIRGEDPDEWRIGAEIRLPGNRRRRSHGRTLD